MILVIGLRKVISGSEEPPLEEIFKTNIIQMISSILRMPDEQEDIRILKVRIHKI